MTDPQINFSDGITNAQREVTERSVAAHVARVSEAATTQRAATAEVAELNAAVNAPLAKLIEANPDAAKELEHATEQRRLLVENHATRLANLITPSGSPLYVSGATFRSLDRIFPIPYHYDWKWHEGTAPSVSDTNLSTGNVTVGVGSCPRSNSHAGFGVTFVANRNAMATTKSLRSTSANYLVSAGYLGGSATSEGGMEMTVFEDGQFVNWAADKRWRKRVSNGESHSWDSDGSSVGEPIEIVWPVVAGRTYNINVGAWVFIETRSGFGLGGFSWAQGNITGKVIFISLFYS